ncbi:dipeptidase 1-like [Chrysoperla carnea]|uniref:dipeptidase 1-like n=1 Tax=Chrysoperla carnea TaxID=189513 RepID=UPI001D0909DC|nr:dipeptidase 1-like [Chrysoperla carnea]
MPHVLLKLFTLWCFGFSVIVCLEDILVIDGHNDLPWNIYSKLGLNLSNYEFTKNLTSDPVWGRENCKSCHTDLPRMKAGKVGAQFWSAYVSCKSSYKDAVELTMEIIDLIHRFVEKYPQHLEFVTTSQGILNAFQAGKIASLIGVEGGHSIDSRLGILRKYYQLGVRYMTLTHSCNTPWADASPVDADPSAPNHAGLTDFGKKVILEMNRLGMLVDISHVSRRVMEQVLEISLAPVIFSHSSAYAINAHHRNVQDDILGKLVVNKGIIMVNFYAGFVAADPQKATIDTIIDHINHIVNITGHDNVGIGGDYDGVERQPQGLEDVSKYQDLFAALQRKNPQRWTVENLKKLGHKNLIRVLAEAEKVRDSLIFAEPDSSVIDKIDLENENAINGDIKKCRSDL